MTAAVVTFAGIGLTGFGSPAQADHTVPTTTNPDLGNSCGIDIVLLLDESGSINSSEASDIIDAYTALLEGLKNTGSEAGVVVYSTTGTVALGYTAINTTTIGSDFTASNLGYSSGGGAGWTNWDDALEDARTFTSPDLVVIFTDGNPTAFNNDPDGSIGGEDPADDPQVLDEAVIEANALKAAGTHMLAVGVSSAPDVENLQAISEDPTPQSAPPLAIDGSTIQGLDIVLSSFANLETAMTELGNALCDPVVDLTKTATDDTLPETGGPFEFTLEITNNSPDQESFTIDSLSDDYSLSTECNNLVGTTVNYGQTVSCAYTVTMGALGGTLVGDHDNTASVSVSDATARTDDDTADETVTVLPAADLSLSKSVDEPQPDVGTNVVFTLTVSNAGPSDATGVTVEDALPSGYTYVSDDGGGAYSSGTDIWTIGTLTNGSSTSLEITASVDASGNYTNYAQVESSNEHDPDSTPGNDSSDEDDDDTAGTDPVPVADVAISKSDNPDPVKAGNNLTYTVTVNNNGPSTASNVVVTDTLPAGVTFVSTSGCAEDPNGVPTCSLGSIAASGSDSYTITVTVDSDTPAGTLTNTASVTTDTKEAITGNNSTSENTQVVESADLSITKDDGVTSVVAGDGVTYTYTVTVSNSGPSDAGV
jgi:uncharacterized repeat protein (TIGR01451 family)